MEQTKASSIVTSATFEQARDALRDGRSAILVCIKPSSRSNLTLGGIYPVERFDTDCSLYFTNERGDEKRLPANKSEAYEYFLYTECKNEAEEIQRDVRAKHAIWLAGCGKAFLTVQPEFKVEQLIEWKPNLKDKCRPQYGEPAVVLEVLAEPVVDPDIDLGSAYSCAVNDIVIGVKSPDGGFVHYYADSRRWQPFQQ